MYVLGRVWRRRASEFGPRAKTWASCNVLEIRVTRLAQHLLAPLYAGALTPALNPPVLALTPALNLPVLLSTRPCCGCSKEAIKRKETKQRQEKETRQIREKTEKAMLYLY